MTYSCNSCGFVFTRAGETSRCPVCESTRVVADYTPEQLTLYGNVITLPKADKKFYPLLSDKKALETAVFYQNALY